MAIYRAHEYNATFLTDHQGQPLMITYLPETHKISRGHWDLGSCQVLLNSVQQFQGGSRKCLNKSEARAAILFFQSAPKHKLGRGSWDLASCQVSLNSVQQFQTRSGKCLNQSDARGGGHLVFSDRPENTNLVEDVEILLPVKFRWIPISAFRGEVENASTNQRPGGHHVFRLARKTQTW